MATKELMTYARDNKLRVFAVDSDNSSFDFRNQHMADRIADKITNGCKSSVLFVGKTHIYEKLIESHPKYSRIRTVPERLRTKGVQSSAIDMISHSDLNLSANSSSPLCSKMIQIPSRDTGWTIDEREDTPAVEKPALDVFQPERWSDYQAVIVVE